MKLNKLFLLNIFLSNSDVFIIFAVFNLIEHCKDNEHNEQSGNIK